MRTANPVLSKTALRDVSRASMEGMMTVQGAVNKTAILLALLLLASSWVWGRASGGAPIQGTIMLGVFGGLITALVTVFKKSWASFTAPVYAALEGLAIGGISVLVEMQYPGIAIQAVSLTFGTLAALLLAYTSRLIRVSDKFRLGIVAATGGICLFYFASFILGLFGVKLPFLYGASPLSIGISLVVVVIAALNLVLDFDFIEQGSASGAPKYMEWYGAFGLMVTLIWLYMEILRLLAKLRESRR